MNKTQLAVLADCSPKSGGYFNNLGVLRTAGLIDYPAPATVEITETGLAQADTSAAPQTSEELQRAILARLSGSQARILEVLIDAYPEVLAKDALANAVGQSSTSGGYFNNLGRLRSLGLIDYPAPGRVVALPVLFLDGGEAEGAGGRRIP